MMKNLLAKFGMADKTENIGTFSKSKWILIS